MKYCIKNFFIITSFYLQTVVIITIFIINVSELLNIVFILWCVLNSPSALVRIYEIKKLILTFYLLV